MPKPDDPPGRTLAAPDAGDGGSRSALAFFDCSPPDVTDGNFGAVGNRDDSDAPNPTFVRRVGARRALADLSFWARHSAF